MRVTYYQRQPDHVYSIERVFDDIRKALPPGIEPRVSRSRYLSRGLWPRVYNMLEAVFRQGDINHITGEVHYLALLLQKKKTILTIHDCVGLERLTGWRYIILWLFWYWLPIKRSRLISTISESSKRQLLKYVKCKADKIQVIHDPVSNDFQPSPHQFNATHPTILQIGTIPRKNLLRVADALRGIPCHWRIIGKLSPEQVEKLEQCGIEYSCTSGLSNAQIVKEYQHADMLVFASTYEGFGVPIVEAHATGRPVVTSNIMSMPEAAGKAALLVDPFDVGSIREGILRIIEDTCYRDELVRLGYENAKRFSPATIAAQYVRLYEEINNDERPPKKIARRR